MKKNKLLNVIVVVLIATMLCISFNVFAIENTLNNECTDINFAEYEKEKYDFYGQVEEKMQVEESEIPEISEKSKRILTSFENEILENEKITKVYDKVLNRETIRITSSDYEIDLDNNGDIVNYKNFEDFSVVDKDKVDYNEGDSLPNVIYEYTQVSDLDNIINVIESENELEKYELIDCSNKIEDVWILTWYRDFDNGLLNPYDCVNVVIDAKDGSIMLFARNKMEPNTTVPVITEERALELATPILSTYCDKEPEVKLTFFRPNFYWENEDTYEMADFVRLSWNVSTKDCTSVQVDALTGEILGGGITQTDCARSMSVVAFVGQQERANMAFEAFNRLGYNQSSYPAVSWAISQTDIDWVLSRSDMYGLYLNCHGGVSNGLSVLADSSNLNNANWQVWSNRNFGNWHFVYLDACLSSANQNFANAFGTIASGRGFVGWNHSVAANAALDFDRRFFPILGQMSVHDAVIQALTASRNAGFYCDPGFIGDTAYWGWAW